jgi:biotin carboxyl carrier protein
MGTHRFTIEGRKFDVEVGPRAGTSVEVTVNGKAYAVEIDSVAAPTAAPTATPAPKAAAPPAPRPTPAAAGGAGEVRAPISGVVLGISAAAGQKVSASTQVLILEAMKMENEIFAGVDGTVSAVHVQAQQEVREGDLLITITPA